MYTDTDAGTAGSDAAMQPDREFVFVAALGGWSDASYATSDLAQHLVDSYDGIEAMRLCSCKYYDFQQNRPMVASIGGERHLMWPESVIYRLDVSDTLSLLLLTGSEPNLYWEDYCTRCLDVAQRYNCSRVITLGSMLDDCTHTRALPFMARRCSRRADGSLYVPATGGADEYTGPVGVDVVLAMTAIDAGIPADTLLISVPRYMEAEDCPQASLDLLRSLSRELGVDLKEGDLPARADDWHKRGDVMTHINPQLAKRVALLERRMDLSDVVSRTVRQTGFGQYPEACDQLVRETEKFLLDVQLRNVNLRTADGTIDAHAIAEIHTRTFGPVNAPKTNPPQNSAPTNPAPTNCTATGSAPAHGAPETRDSEAGQEPKPNSEPPKNR